MVQKLKQKQDKQSCLMYRKCTLNKMDVNFRWSSSFNHANVGQPSLDYLIKKANGKHFH